MRFKPKDFLKNRGDSGGKQLRSQSPHENKDLNSSPASLPERTSQGKSREDMSEQTPGTGLKKSPVKGPRFNHISLQSNLCPRTLLKTVSSQH